MRVTEKDVQDFWKYMAKKYDFKVVKKGDSDEMKIVGQALDQMNIQKKKEFLEQYTTTVIFGGWRCVYVPFEIGKGSQAQLIHQIATCVHECQHVVQADREVAQQIKYLTSDASRAYYEADAYRATMEMHWYFTGRILSPKSLANGLKSYSIGKADRRIAEKHLIIASKVVKRGGVITGTSKVAIRWWNRRKKVTSFRNVSLIPLKVA